MLKGGGKNFQLYRPAKHVTWDTSLPPIEADDLKAKKVMKDAPKGLEGDHSAVEEVVNE